MALTPSPWHAWDEQNVLLNLDSHPDGLSHQEARHRLTDYGPNRLTPPKGESWFHRFARQFNNLLIYVLLLAAALSWLSNHWIDGAVILGVVIINALFGLLQEGKAERALAAIRQLLKIRCMTLRDGERHQLDADLLVPGDVVMLESGDKVPADMRLLECHNLYVQESALTGESVSVNKQTQALSETTPLAERNNMLYAGTLVTQGRARAIVVSTGDDTELGHIGRLLQTVEAMQTPLTLQMDRLGRQLTLWIVLLAIATFLFGLLYRHYGLDELFMAAVGLAVAAIPEGLPAVITITLAIGVQRMAQRNAIVRRLPAVETLGAVTVICSDKTGTLTRNEMTVQQVALPHETLQVTGVGYATQGELRSQSSHLDGKAPMPSAFIDDTDALWSLLEAAVLCNDARFSPPTPDKESQLHGDPTEGALLILAAKAGIDAQMLRNANPRLAELPFESAHGFMATLNLHEGQRRLFIKGAPERILPRCERLAGSATDAWQGRADEMARAGLRLLAFAVHP
ncbi:MAG: HAD-IC family P-type ATPase, partial [Aeromonadaceae bacterium]